ncbi:MAG: hypothetical protein D8M59_08020 [Planctomycetes bacterium]|nr:hypothetical protein [Planctomycetota bacterium]NOG53270.1 sulfatase-like hydrolase/transferase [Planctomycetota bacterium]
MIHHLLCVTLAITAAQPALLPLPPDHPNIILFIVDDLGWQDLSVPLYNDTPTEFNQRYQTPNVKRLAEVGMRFTSAYASAPVCTPTRTSIMTGRSPGQSHITYWTLHKDRDTSTGHPTLRPPNWNVNGLQSDDVTLPKLLKEKVGYHTIHVGKAHFGAHDTSGADPTNLGFDVNIAGHASGGPASYYGTQHFTVAGRQGKQDPHSAESVWDIPGLEKYHGSDIYLTEALAIEASAAIRDAVLNVHKPFYLNFAPYAVHAPIMPNERYLDQYPPDLNRTEAAYATMVQTYDAALGAITETLRDLDIIDDTIIIFTSDNGGLSAHARGGDPHTHNAPLRSGKGSAYEGGIRVPLIIAWPGVTEPNSESHMPVISHDLFTTILMMAGIEAFRVPSLKSIEGQDFTWILRDEVVDFEPYALYWHQPHQWGVSGPGIEPFTAINLFGMKLIYFHAGPRFELYDLDEDIGETNDLCLIDMDEAGFLAAWMDDWIKEKNVQMSIDKETNQPVPMPSDALNQYLAPEKAMLERAANCVPSPRQIAWQRQEFAAFVHFGINTFTDREWGTGTEDPALFNPTDFDADQWVRTFKEAGMKQVILTAKHHDGFCLWPSAYNPDHTVKNSPWKNGTGDVVRAVSDACQKHGLNFGFYLSPADLYQIESENGYYGNGSTAVSSTIPTSTSPHDGKKFEYTVDDYNRYFLNQLYELLTQYGPVNEVWFDGANPKPGTGQTYNYAAWYDMIRTLAPEAVIAIKGPDVRWVGNEAGKGRESEWSVIPLDGPPQTATWPDMTAADLGSRDKIRDAKYLHWHPAETDVSIRPGWFYHASQDDQVKSLDHLLDIYYASVGNNCSLLLNVPPDRRGLIHENDVARLTEFGDIIRTTFSKDLARGGSVWQEYGLDPNLGETHPPSAILDDNHDAWWATSDWEGPLPKLIITLPEPVTFNRIMLQEHIANGQHIEKFEIDSLLSTNEDEGWHTVASGTTIGYKKLIRLDEPVTADRIRIRILSTRVRATLSNFGLYLESSH